MAAPFPVRVHGVIDSTNAEAARLAAAGQMTSLWITATGQTAGRGRHGRSWISPSGGVYATLLLISAAPPSTAPQLSLVMGIAVHECLSVFIPPEKLALKWPNDCLANGSKLCGVLVEGLGATPLRLAIGCGINVMSSPPGLPYAAAAVRDHAPFASCEAVFAELASSTSRWLDIWSEGRGFAEIRKAWMARSVPMGHAMIVNGSSGAFAGLADDGALLLAGAAGRTQKVLAGDVALARETA